MNINQVWPEWNEDCVLGEGSFGKVYRAKRVEFGRTFYSAIKVLTVPKNQQEIKAARSQGMDEEALYNYFRSLVDNLINEISLMDNLKGAKNIVGIEDYKIIEHEGEIGWDIFIRMELLTPFDSFISNSDFSQKDVIKLGVDICTALEVCEQNYIVHRDIKPDNIFISRFGEYKLGDFGIARKLEATQANLSRKGTLNYMAPEVYKSEQYGSNVDIYSLGLVLYTLLNNNRVAFLPPYPQPISYKDNEEALSKRLSGVPLIPPCNASASLGQTILRACAYRPQDRYRTATEFKNALITEWNVLVQSGDNKEIKSDGMRFGSNIEEKLQSTTNDMTANGHLLIDEYAAATTSINQNDENLDNFYDYDQQYSNVISVGVPEHYSNAKSNKACKILAKPLAFIICILAFVLMLRGMPSLTEKTVSIAILGIGLSILLCDLNKNSVGISVVSLSLVYIVNGVVSLLGETNNELPIIAVVSTLSGLLLLLGGIVILSQKEVRFGSALCMYSLAVEWLFNVYQMINKNFNLELWNIFSAVTIVSVLIWAYGFNSDDKIKGKKIVLQIITYVLAAVSVLQSALFVVVSMT